MRIPDFNFGVSKSWGFTLLELLVSMAVLALVLVFLSQAIEAVSRTWRSGVARIDNFAKARVILGLLDRDIQSIVLRRDLGAFVSKSGDASACAFYSRIGAQTDRRLSLVSYGLENPSVDNPVLKRASYGLSYDTNATSTLSLTITNALPDLDKAASQDVARGILRFECQFLATNGTIQPGFQFDFDNRDAAANTKALIVSVLVLDDGALRQTQGTGKLGDLLVKFAATPSVNQTYAQLWNENLRSPTFCEGLSDDLRQGVRVFERHILLP